MVSLIKARELSSCSVLVLTRLLQINSTEVALEARICTAPHFHAQKDLQMKTSCIKRSAVFSEPPPKARLKQANVWI